MALNGGVEYRQDCAVVPSVLIKTYCRINPLFTCHRTAIKFRMSETLLLPDAFECGFMYDVRRYYTVEIEMDTILS